MASVKSEKTLAELVQLSDVHPNQIATRKAQPLEGAAGAVGSGSAGTAAAPAVDLKTPHANLGELALANDFLSGALGKAGLLNAKSVPDGPNTLVAPTRLAVGARALTKSGVYLARWPRPVRGIIDRNATVTLGRAR